jgi:hypothetical protein
MSTIYDELTLRQAKSLFAEYIREEEPSEAIVFMIKAALENKKGNFDKNKVGLLVENPHDIKNEKFLQAVELIKQAKTSGELKVYYQFYIRENNKYVELNLKIN